MQMKLDNHSGLSPFAEACLFVFRWPQGTELEMKNEAFAEARVTAARLDAAEQRLATADSCIVELTTALTAAQASAADRIAELTTALTAQTAAHSAHATTSQGWGVTTPTSAITAAAKSPARAVSPARGSHGGEGSPGQDVERRLAAAERKV